MDTIQLTTACTEDSYIQPLFYGVIAIDQLPSKWPLIGMYIINQDVQTGPGIHWYALVGFGRSETRSIYRHIWT